MKIFKKQLKKILCCLFDYYSNKCNVIFYLRKKKYFFNDKMMNGKAIESFMYVRKKNKKEFHKQKLHIEKS